MIIIFGTQRCWMLTLPLIGRYPQEEIVEVSGKSNAVSLLFSSLKLFSILLRKDVKTVIVETGMNYGAVINLAKIFFKFDLFFFIRGNPYKENKIRKYRIYESIFHKLVANSVCVIPISRYLENDLRDHMPSSKMVYPLYIPVFGSIVRGPKDRRKEVLIVTSFRFRKKNARLIDFLPTLDLFLSNNESFCVTILGGGEYLNEFMNCSAHLNNSSRLTFYGKQKNITHHYQRASICLYISNLDAYGLVINEARSNGLPVIVNDAVGLSEQIRNHVDGVKINTNRELYLALDRLSKKSSYREQIITNGLKLMKDKFSTDRFADRLYDITRSGTCK